jgi:hypothetical protein
MRHAKAADKVEGRRMSLVVSDRFVRAAAALPAFENEGSDREEGLRLRSRYKRGERGGGGVVDPWFSW